MLKFELNDVVTIMPYDKVIWVSYDKKDNQYMFNVQHWGEMYAPKYAIDKYLRWKEVEILKQKSIPVMSFEHNRKVSAGFVRITEITELTRELIGNNMENVVRLQGLPGFPDRRIVLDEHVGVISKCLHVLNNEITTMETFDLEWASDNQIEL